MTVGRLLDAASRVGSFVRPLAVPLAVGIALRVLWVVGTAGPPDGGTVSDPTLYYLSAIRVTAGEFGMTPEWPYGNDEPTSFLSVGYPALLGVLSWVTFGTVGVFAMAIVVNLVSSAALIVGVSSLADAVAGGTAGTAGVYAAWAVALYPDLITANGLMMTELLGAALVVWLLVAVLRPAPDPWIVGTLLAAAIWIRPSLQLLLVAVPVVLWFRVGRRRAMQTLVGACVLLAPLAWHSSVTVGVPVFSSSTWPNVCDGAAPDPGTPRGAFVAAERCRLEGLSVPPEREWSKLSREVALDAIGDDPLHWVAQVPFRLGRTLGGGWGIEVAQQWSGHLGSSRPMTLATGVSDVAAYAVLVVGLAGAVVLRRSHEVQLAILVTALALVGVAISFGQQRYGVPTVVVLLLPCGAALIARFRDQPRAARAAS